MIVPKHDASLLLPSFHRQDGTETDSLLRFLEDLTTAIRAGLAVMVMVMRVFVVMRSGKRDVKFANFSTRPLLSDLEVEGMTGASLDGKSGHQIINKGQGAVYTSTQEGTRYAESDHARVSRSGGSVSASATTATATKKGVYAIVRAVRCWASTRGSEVTPEV
jgi:hypothetical protein